MHTENKKSNELISLLEQFANTSINGLTEFAVKCIEDINVEHCDYRAGFSSRVGAFEEGYSHFYVFVKCCLVYFSKNTIYIRYQDEENMYRDIHRGTFDEFFEQYFQLSTQYSLLSKEFFIRVHNFSKSYNWIEYK